MSSLFDGISFSSYSTSMSLHFLNDLTKLIASRKSSGESSSYTASLFEGGLDRMLKKIGEEAGEVIIAAKNRDAEEVSNESADLLFHLMIVLEEQGLTLADVVSVLESRHKS